MNLQTWQILLSPSSFSPRWQKQCSISFLTATVLHYLFPLFALLDGFQGEQIVSWAIPFLGGLSWTLRFWCFSGVSLWFAHLHPVFKHKNLHHTQLFLQPWQFTALILFHLLFPASSQTPGCLSHISLWMPVCQLKHNTAKKAFQSFTKGMSLLKSQGIAWKHQCLACSYIPMTRVIEEICRLFIYNNSKKSFLLHPRS